MQRNNQHKEFATSYGLQATGLCHARGVTVILVLAFMGIFALILGTVTSYVLQQGKYGRAISAREQALHIAEAGLEYYKWWLGHHPEVMTNTNGEGLISPYTYTVNDPEGGTPLGSAEIKATPALQCGAVQWIDLESKGTSNSSPNFPRTLLARYMKPSVAEYSNILNSHAWYSASDATMGPVHSNGGIHMEGSYNSNVTSAVSTWTCDADFGCDGTGTTHPSAGTKNGVFKGDQSFSSPLWKWGSSVQQINFNNMVNFTDLQTKAQSYGIKLSPTSITVAGEVVYTFPSVGNSTQKGFHLVFRPDGKLDVYRVTVTDNITAYSATLGWMSSTLPWADYHFDDHPDIIDETLVNLTPISIPSSCALIFSQAKTWIEGVISGKVTVVAGDTGTPNFNPDIEIPNNITYETNDGSAGLTAIAEGSVLIPLKIIPDTLTIRGIFVALGGSFERRYYDSTGAEYSVPSAYNGYVVRPLLNVMGTVVSNQRPWFWWTDGGTVISGFQTKVGTYDRILAFSPPPFTPTASTTYQLKLWREK